MKMILRLLLIFSLSSIVCSFTPEIDLKRCKSETACFIRQSCLVEESTTAAKIEMGKAKLLRYTNKPLNYNTCDVILQARSFSPEKFHIMVQVNSTDPSVPVTEVKLEQNGVQFRCSYGRATTENTEFQISQFGELPTEQPNILFCSFTIKSSKSFAVLFDDNNEKPEIIIVGQTRTIVFGQKSEALWADIRAAQTCDPDIINTKESGNDTHSFGKVDNTASPIRCSALESMMIIRADGRQDFTDKLTCNYPSTWSYKRRNGDKIETAFIDYVNNVQETVLAHCVRKVCSLCEPIEHEQCAGCAKVMYNNDTGACSTSTCPDGLWRISEGGGLPVEGEMKCDHKAGSQDQKRSVWYFTPKGKSEIQEMSKAACAIDAVCLHPNPDQITTITRIGCPQIDGQSLSCGVVQEQGSKKDLYCPNGYQLRYQHEDKITDSTNLTCSTITGQYSDDANNIVPDGSEIFCEEIIETTTTATTTAVPTAALSSVALLGIGAATVILLVAVGCGSFIIYGKIRFKRRLNEVMEEQAKKENVEQAKITARQEWEKAMSYKDRMDYEEAGAQERRVNGHR